MADTEKEGSYRWLNEYEKTWEVLQEDETGSIQATIDDIVQKAKRKRLLVRKKNVRLGMMRHLFLVVDLSKAMEESDLLRPSRIACAEKLVERFIMEYFDQNPISQLSIIVTRNKRAEKITDLSGNPKLHISELHEAINKGCIGEPSLQNSLELATSILRHLPTHASREILIVFGSLTTCDPGDISETIEALKGHSIQCSIVGLSAEIYICKKLCQETKGIYSVALDENHFKDLLLEHIRPPEAKANSEASLIRMGFPTHMTKGPLSLCMCHIEGKTVKGFGTSGYFCPQCRSKYCELPVECKVCGLTLVSAPHLARSYQHLFPLQTFNELQLNAWPSDKECVCKGCQQVPTDQTVYNCPDCNELFCLDCDSFIHEILHTCPGCTSICKPESELANGHDT